MLFAKSVNAPAHDLICGFIFISIVYWLGSIVDKYIIIRYKDIYAHPQIRATRTKTLWGLNELGW
jgi:hypothetical protein